MAFCFCHQENFATLSCRKVVCPYDHFLKFHTMICCLNEFGKFWSKNWKCLLSCIYQWLPLRRNAFVSGFELDGRSVSCWCRFSSDDQIKCVILRDQILRLNLSGQLPKRCCALSFWVWLVLVNKLGHFDQFRGT